MRILNDLPDLRRSYDALATPYAQAFGDELHRQLVEVALIDALLAHVPLSSAVLDVGCGPGQLASYVSARGSPVTGIDVSARMLRTAREATGGAMSAVQADLRRLPVRAESVGCVFAFYALVHLSDGDLARSMTEFHRVLKPGGIVLVAFIRGETDQPVHEWLGVPVRLVDRYLRPDVVVAAAERADLRVEANVLRTPYRGEISGDRSLIVLRRPISRSTG